MTELINDDEYEHLCARIDTLENVLCDLATFGEDREAITIHDLKKALNDAGIIDTEGGSP